MHGFCICNKYQALGTRHQARGNRYLLVIFLLPIIFLLAPVSQHLTPNQVFASDHTYLIHTDHLGSVVAVSDESGNNVQQSSYSPYGSAQSTANSLQTTERGYTGQIKDQTSLSYYNARYYDSVLSRFISPDSTNNQVNRFVYVGGNPIIHNDPSGHDVGNPGKDGLKSPPPHNPFQPQNAEDKDNELEYVLNGYFRSEIHLTDPRYIQGYTDFLDQAAAGMTNSMTFDEKVNLISENVLNIINVKDNKELQNVFESRGTAIYMANFYDYVLNHLANPEGNLLNRLISQNTQLIYDAEKRAMDYAAVQDRAEQKLYDEYSKSDEFILQIYSNSKSCSLTIFGTQLALKEILGIHTDIQGQLYQNRPDLKPTHFLLTWNDARDNTKKVIDPYFFKNVISYDKYLQDKRFSDFVLKQYITGL
jgi:RHS repeat-associated protein